MHLSIKAGFTDLAFFISNRCQNRHRLHRIDSGRTSRLKVSFPCYRRPYFQNGLKRLLGLIIKFKLTKINLLTLLSKLVTL